MNFEIQFTATVSLTDQNLVPRDLPTDGLS